LKRYFVKPFTKADVLEANEVITAHGEPFNLAGWLRLIEKHDGKLPLRVRAVAEGSIVPTRNVLMTVENTDDEFFWLTGWFESQFMRIWYPITVATQSWYIKRDVYQFLQETADDADAEIGFKVHDFGSRGVSSQETAAIGGAAHLVNFFGSDTMASLLIHRNFYNCEMAGFSIPAAEHSTITSWGRENEIDAYRNILKHFAKPNLFVAVVSDSWNIYEAVEKIWGEQLKQEVIDSGATIVIRPDSGDPVEVVGKVAELLSSKFGCSINSKGYKVLKNVRIIQGDGVNPVSIHNICQSLKDKGFSTSNIAFGIGGALLQKIDRDTMKFAYKCSAIVRDGNLVDVYKEPITDSGKSSKKGRLDLIKDENGEYKTVVLPDATTISAENSQLTTVFENGQVLVDDNLEAIRNRAKL
jgi:nicotinamide phosphoribosyltransferase